ncbi:MAG: triose-phosphate isomerase [Candidatus Moranbacteria bacterium]|nr:triose-phosphate isomerase [Candidatus Moranbacteria bacterium]
MGKLLIGNLKMNILSSYERDRYFSDFNLEMKKYDFPGSSLVLCPPSLHIEAFRNNFGETLSVGAQNVFWEDKGSYTGEISPKMLKNFGVEYVIVGHSERRKFLGENGRIINAKVTASLKANLKPVLCIGETRQEKDANQIVKVLTLQIREALHGVSKLRAGSIIIAYEPIWSVGTDKIPSSNEIMEAKVIIRKIIFSMFDRNIAESIPVIYGGSVSSFTAKQVCVDSAMDGALVGRESLIPKEFLKIAGVIGC